MRYVCVGGVALCTYFGIAASCFPARYKYG